jgi:hypothetical protein
MTRKHDLLGLWLLWPNPDYEGYYLAGQITRSIGDEYHLIEIRAPENVQTFAKLRSTADLCADDVTFFNTETELDDWLAAVDNEPHVVPLPPKETH